MSAISTPAGPDPELANLETEMNRGFLQILVLTLLEEAMYGYAMARLIEAKGYRLEENTLYPLLRRLEKNGWISGRWEVGGDRPRKFYAVTARGREIRTALLGLWRRQNDILESLAKELTHGR